MPHKKKDKTEDQWWGSLSECILLMPASMARGMEVAIAPQGTAELPEPCLILYEGQCFHSADGPMIIVDRWQRLVTADDLQELEAKAVKLGLEVVEQRYFPEEWNAEYRVGVVDPASRQ